MTAWRYALPSNAASAADPSHLLLAASFLDGLSLPAQVAAWTILAATIFSIGLLLAILVLHLVNSRRTRRTELLSKQWLITLISPESVPSALHVEEGYLVAFMRTWLHLLESLRGDFRERLLSFLRRSEIPQHLRMRLRKAGAAERILCLETLGSVQDLFSTEAILPLVRESDPIVSLHAATALLSINPQDLIQELLPHFLWREDWPLSRVHSFLRAAPSDLVGEHLARFVRSCGPACPPRALRLLELLPHQARSEILTELLGNADPLPVSTQCILLGSIHDPGVANLARDRIRHPQWPVVLAAVRALGRVGNLEDIPAMTDLLDHPQWWVRYRAAGAIVSLPQLKPIQVELLAAQHPDPLAGDMLRFALAERSLA
ncbi:MAG: HEAT repeat domain-containing protein [Fibrobacteres bacterium]|nr:HEAT repeat domain-containing protein [Fibrobacterota bacterium]